ncbi:MAG: hypothetical protein CI952_48 [Methanohalophilus sp.]|nr:MAG: hypothetical protein CI952_48 [Methanohalophilus sp.]
MEMNDATEILLKTSEGRRALAKNSISFFLSYYLGLDIDKHHEEWISRVHIKRLHYEAPRDHGKSTIFSFGYPLWLLYHVPNVRTLVVSRTGGSSGVSTKVREAIIEEMKTNNRLLEDYGKIITKEKGGNIWVKRTKRGIKDPSLESVGVGGSITGGHYDFILVDDLIDPSNSRTQTMRDYVADWFNGTLMELLEPDSQIIVVGTRKHWDDLYKYILDNKLWNSYIDKAIIRYPDHYEIIAPDEETYEDMTFEEADRRGGELKIINDVKVYVEGDYEVLWKEKWDIFQLLYNKYDIGSILFNREKQNDPSGMQGKILNVEWLQFYEKKDLPNDLIVYQGVDLAISEKETSDYMSICTVGYSPSKQIVYVLEFWRGHRTFPEQIGMIERFGNKWDPIRITIESNAYQNAMIQYHHAVNMLPVVGSPTTKDKTTRMLAISPQIENGKILFNRDIPYYENFEEEFVQFPYGAHDDTLDSLEICVRPIFQVGQIHIGDWSTGKDVAGEKGWFSI